MVAYTVHFHEEGHDAFRTEEFAACDDAAAEVYAERLSLHGPAELWRGNRLVKRWPGATEAPLGNAAADDERTS